MIQVVADDRLWNRGAYTEWCPLCGSRDSRASADLSSSEGAGGAAPKERRRRSQGGGGIHGEVAAA
jgi:hypothetical protein